MIKVNVRLRDNIFFQTDYLTIEPIINSLSHFVLFKGIRFLDSQIEYSDIIDIEIYFVNSIGNECLIYNLSFIVDDVNVEKNGFSGNLVTNELVNYNQHVVNFMINWSNSNIDWINLTIEEKKAYLLCCFFWSGLHKKDGLMELNIDANLIYHEYDIYYYLSKNFGERFYFGYSLESFEDCMFELDYPSIKIKNLDLLIDRLGKYFIETFLNIIKV